MSMLVKVGKMPGRVGEYALNSGATVREALVIAELDNQGFEIKVNGAPATLDTVLNNGDNVLLVQMVKGNMPIVKVGKMPGRVEEYAVNEGATVAEVLELAELDSTGYEIKVNGAPANFSTVLREGDNVLLVQLVKGNR